MVPINHNPDDPRERRYNRAHKSTRVIVECSYGILKNRFPCLRHLRIEPTFAGKILMVCATLHNVTNKEDFNVAVQYETENDHNNAVIPGNVAGPRAQAVLDYFNY